MHIRASLWFKIIIILNVSTLLDSTATWGDRQLFPPDQIPENALSPKRAVVRRKIVTYHNFFRTKVRPTASNMLMMTWHAGAARQAQRYAEKCIFLQHNNPQENIVPDLGTCGQNLFVAAQKTPWFFALRTWFVEYRNFTYGHPVVNLKVVGHYTQMVWATSHKVGCGFAHCPGGPWGHFYNYVCHYCPGGNYDTITHYPYKTGKKCADCKDQCVAHALCTNACPKKDVYTNCNEIVNISPNFCRDGYCNATCACGDNRIHKNYPWK
ncbi:cysteine-rich venom protein TEL1 isoform X2 [Manduca sexta]|nr:cysteine-rich venom protein TEL1 isoform X2 [Manduca sexta]XP_030027006.1 cysteine-rich venom protein TEL1 isoform X2 [Manduca sexta]